MLGGCQHDDTAGLADGNRRAHVLPEVDVLERHRGGAMPREELREILMDLPEPTLERLVRGSLDDTAVDGGHLASRDAHDPEARARHARIDPHDDYHAY